MVPEAVINVSPTPITVAPATAAVTVDLDAIRGLLENLKIPPAEVVVEAAKPKNTRKTIEYDQQNRPCYVVEEEIVKED